MQFCQPHWDKLRAAIAERGLSHRIAQDGRAAAGRMKAEFEGTATDRTYDPLMDAHNMIVARALELGGLYLMTGDYCPICEAVTHSPKEVFPSVEDVERYWIDGPADSVKTYCVEHGLAG